VYGVLSPTQNSQVFPFSRLREKVADRPDEGVAQQISSSQRQMV
jgi:hypothetical protein